MIKNRTNTLTVVDKRILVARRYSADLQDRNNEKNCTALFWKRFSHGQVINLKERKESKNKVLSSDLRERENIAYL